MNLDFEIQ